MRPAHTPQARPQSAGRRRVRLCILRRVAEADEQRGRLDGFLALARSGPGAVRSLLAGLDAEDLARKPGVGKLSLLGHLCHLREMEERVFGVRLERVLAEDNPTLEPLVVEDHVVPDDDLVTGEFTVEDLAEADVEAVLAAWEAARSRNIERAENTGPEEWSRPARHPQLGSATFFEIVERWSRHDTDHVRQIEILALNSRERNLP